jgi:hypothetical protein
MKTIRVGRESKLFDVLASAALGPVLLEQNGEIYQVSLVTRPPDPFRDYDPVAARDALRKASLALEGVDTEALKARLHAERGQADRLRP